MGTAIVNYTHEASGSSGWGILKDGVITPLITPYADHRELMAHYFADPTAFRAATNTPTLATGEVQFNSPISRNVQLFCQGLNYLDHREESGASTEEKEENLIFMKAASSICAPNADILRPRGCELLDYEIELALVLKRDITQATAVPEHALGDYVGALVLCNDVSARDIMFGASMLQWFRGKSQRTFCPMGPVLYLMDEDDFQYLYQLQLTLKLNGQVKQSATTDQLIHRPAATLQEISTFADMAAGDCLLTGTPGGVLAGTNLKVGLSIITNMTNDAKRRRKFTQAQLQRTQFLQPGDTLELSLRTPDGAIDLGAQRNLIAQA